jgi:hypothetical protein
MKVYVITIHEVYDFEDFHHTPRVFDSFEKAKKELKAIAKQTIKENKRYGNDDWEVEQGDPYFSTYPDGCWGTSHYDAKISEAEIE